ncbi:sortase domain-bontaining protein [Streptomyces globisporus]|uniref:sortase domain-containing protein n=1 Tax=Streptomyces globisporus TaxID=1908 RepID=UPI003694A742
MRRPGPRRSAPRLLARGFWGSAEVALTLGLVLLLLVAHQLWWTNREARADAGRTVQGLQGEWDDQSAPDGEHGSGDGGRAREATPRTSSPGPEAGGPPPLPPGRTPPPPPLGTGVRRPAHPPDRAHRTRRRGHRQGRGVRPGYVRHYTRSAQAGQAGNFAPAGHRNTRGEPFRRIDRLRGGDRITVETRDAVYTYTVGKRLARTAPSDSGVIAPVPRGNVTMSVGYSEPGYYLTLTTCTSEFSSRYRLVVWGKLTAMRPRCPAPGGGNPMAAPARRV